MITSSKPKTFWRCFLQRLLRWTFLAALCYLAFIVFLVVMEPRLVYPGASTSHGDYLHPPQDCEEVWIQSADGTNVHGWFLKNSNRRRTILFCHGNAENVAMVGKRFGDRLRRETQSEVFVFDYRGFGKTGGSPSESLVIADAEAALDWLAHRTGRPPAEITLYGRSLGGGIAIQLASRHGAKALILDRTFDNLVSPGAQKYPWVPVSLLMRNRFDSDKHILNCRAPIFQSHFADDELIPLASARRLFSMAANENSKFLEMPGGGHLNPLPEIYWHELAAFLDRITDSPSTPNSSEK